VRRPNVPEHEWIDITVPLENGMVEWPGDTPVRVSKLEEIARGDELNVTAVAMTLHAGTHIDAPRHFFRDGKSIEQMPIEATVGPARVIEIEDPECIRAEVLTPHHIGQGERILFKTQNSVRFRGDRRFHEDFVYVARDAAEHLVERGVRVVGIDYLSIGGFHTDLFETHQILLGASIWVIETLDLTAVAPGNYDMICLPLRVPGIDGAPARAVLRPR
jgi:arylformamidase